MGGGGGIRFVPLIFGVREVFGFGSFPRLLEIGDRLLPELVAAVFDGVELVEGGCSGIPDLTCVSLVFIVQQQR